MIVCCQLAQYTVLLMKYICMIQNIFHNKLQTSALLAHFWRQKVFSNHAKLVRCKNNLGYYIPLKKAERSSCVWNQLIIHDMTHNMECSTAPQQYLYIRFYWLAAMWPT